MTNEEIYELIESEKLAWDIIETTRQRLNYIATIHKREWKMDNPIELAQQLLDEIDGDIKTSKLLKS